MSDEQHQLIVRFCGETYHLSEDSVFTIGREGDLKVDDNPFLHRRFLLLEFNAGMWWIVNVGSQLAATVADSDGLVQAWLAPGARLPLVFGTMAVRFTAGASTYEVEIDVPDPSFAGIDAATTSGATTIVHLPLTVDQRLLIVALAEDVLRHGWRAGASVPTSAEAARRLGWTITKFNRKLDNVCQKLTKIGVRGLHGTVDALASSRRGRLVEYAVSARLVTSDDLALLVTATQSY